MNSSCSKWLVWCGAALAAACAAPNAHAEYVLVISQVGSDVVGSGSGSVNLSALSFFSSAIWNSFIEPDIGIWLGPTSSVGIDVYGGFTFPPTFGSSTTRTYASSGSGDLVGVFNDGVGDEYLDLPEGYISGTSLSSSDTWSNTTIAGLGLSDGDYTFSWGSATTADSLVVEIGQSGSPEPASFWLLAAGGLLFGLARLKRRLA